MVIVERTNLTVFPSKRGQTRVVVILRYVFVDLYLPIIVNMVVTIVDVVICRTVREASTIFLLNRHANLSIIFICYFCLLGLVKINLDGVQDGVIGLDELIPLS